MTDQLTDLLAERPAQLDDAESQSAGTVGRHVETPSPTVLALDKFSEMRGVQLSDEWNAADMLPVGLPCAIVADANAAMFEARPKLAERPSDKARAAWWKQLMETAEYHGLHNQTMWNSELSALAAKRLCDQWLEYEADQPEQPEGQPGDGQPEPGSDDEDISTTLGRIKSTQQAVQQAQQDVDTAKDISAGLGLGEGAQLDSQALARYFKQVQNNHTLRAILSMAGRMRKLCQSLQKQKTHAKRGEITGIEMAGDLSRLVPRERLALCGAIGPELQERAAYRLLRKRALCYKHRRNEPQNSGPIVICVDESGSMSGERIIAAKGLVMAMAWLAQYQNRWIALASFSGGRDTEFLALPPKHNQQEQLITWLLHMYGGGTTLDVPLDVVPNEIWPDLDLPRGKTDHIIITDAQVSADHSMVANYNTWADAERVKTYGIVIGGREPGGLAKVCDRVFCVPNLDLESAAIETALSI